MVAFVDDMRCRKVGMDVEIVDPFDHSRHKKYGNTTS
jgi:hypothetical protein